MRDDKDAREVLGRVKKRHQLLAVEFDNSWRERATLTASRFLNYRNTLVGIQKFWDVDRDIRRAIQSDLAMISGKDVDWQRLTAETERLGIRMEQESDLARRQEVFENTRDSNGGNPSR